MFVQVSGIIISNIYRADDKPECMSISTPLLRIPLLDPLMRALIDRRGNRQLVAICAANIVIYALAKSYYIWRNKQRETEWNGMTRDVSPAQNCVTQFQQLICFQQQILYLETTTDQGSKRKDFRFAH